MDEQEIRTGSEPAGAGKADFDDDPRKVRNYDSLRRDDPRRYKGGAAKLLAGMYRDGYRANPSRHRSGAARLLEEMHAEDAEAEVEEMIRRTCKGGAAEMLARRSYEHWKARQPRRKNFKSGAARRLQEIYDQQAMEGGVVLDADFWTEGGEG